MAKYNKATGTTSAPSATPAAAAPKITPPPAPVVAPAPTTAPKAPTVQTAPPAAAPAPATAPVAKTAVQHFRFSKNYWTLKNLLNTTMLRRLTELKDAGNTEFLVEGKALNDEFTALSKNGIPTAKEVGVVFDKYEDFIARVHAKCDEIRALKPPTPIIPVTSVVAAVAPKPAAPAPNAPAPTTAPKAPTVQTAPPAAAPAPAPKPAAPPIIPVTSVVAAVAPKTPAPAPAAPKAPPIQVAPAPKPTAPAPNAPAPTTAPKAPTVQTAPPAAAPATPPPAPPAAPSAPAVPVPAPVSWKPTWVDWLIIGLLIAALIGVGIWWFSGKSPKATTKTADAVSTTLVCNDTNGASVHIAKSANDTGSVVGIINVGNSNSGSVIGVQNNNQTYNYYYGKRPEVEAGAARDGMNNNVTGQESQANQASGAKKVLHIAGWKPWPTVDCSRLVLVPRPAVVDGEIEKTLYLEDGQIAVLDTPVGCHYWYQETGAVTALEGIDEFCHAHVAGLPWPAQVKERDQQIGVEPAYHLWLTPKSGKAMTLHIKLIRDHY